MNRERMDWVSELSEAYGRMVFSTAFRVLGNPQDAEDVLQEVFLKLLGGWSGRVKPDSVQNWGAYLRVTALRTAVDWLRKKPRHRQETIERAQELATPGDVCPRHIASQKQKARLLRQAVGQLPERDAKVFAMRYFEDFSYEEIAEHLSVTVNQIGVILHRTRERLKSILLPLEQPSQPGAAAVPERSVTGKEIGHA